MAKKKKDKKTTLVVIKIVSFFLLTLSLGAGFFFGLNHFFHTCSYFHIRTVRIDPALHFIDTHALKKMIGKNIFDADLESIGRKLSYQYPQVEQLKIIKKFPNELHITAKKRKPTAQLAVRKKYYVFDDKGAVVAASNNIEKKYPLIEGVRLNQKKLALGETVHDKELKMALDLIHAFMETDVLKGYAISVVDMRNTSKIQVELTNELVIFFEPEKIYQKMKFLGVVLSQKDFKLKEVKYVDLRFKEPIIGKK